MDSPSFLTIRGFEGGAGYGEYLDIMPMDVEQSANANLNLIGLLCFFRVPKNRRISLSKNGPGQKT
jgi:hypothetical protein